MPPIPELSVMVTDTLEAASPAGPAVQAVSSPKLPVCVCSYYENQLTF